VFWPFKRESRASKETVGHPQNADADLARLFRINDSTVSGVDIDHNNAMQIEAVFACVRLLAQTVASLPIFLYKRTPDGQKVRADNHPMYRLLHDTPNPRMTSYEFREVMQASLETRGNAYAEIVRDNAGRPVELWPIPARLVRVSSTGWDVRYTVRTVDGDKDLPVVNMLHLKYLAGSDGLIGVDPIAAMREGLGLTAAARDYGSSFFGNGAHMGGVLKHPKGLSDNARKNLKKSLDDAHKGSDKAHRWLLLEDGLEWAQTGIAPENAQFLETRKYQTAEVARIFGVPPHLIGDLERATFSNIEEQGINFVVHTVRPRLVRWEQALNRAILSDTERNKFFFEFQVDGLLRGNIQARYAAYQTGILSGFINRNEVRAWENLNRADGLDEFLVQPGMANGQTQIPDNTKDAKPDDAPPEETPDGEDRAVEILAEQLAKGALHEAH